MSMFKIFDVAGSAASAQTQRLNVVASINQKNSEVAKVQTDVEGQTEKLKSNKLKVAQTDSELKRVEDELKTKNDKMAMLQDQLKKLPAGFNPQTIAEDLNKIKQEIAELQTQAEAKKLEVAGVEKKVGESKKVLEDIVAKIEARKKVDLARVNLNALISRVILLRTEAETADRKSVV